MRTTLLIDDEVFRELKKRAAQEGRSLSELTEEALRRGLAKPRADRTRRTVKIRTFSMGKASIDVADRDQLFEVFGRP